MKAIISAVIASVLVFSGVRYAGAQEFKTSIPYSPAPAAVELRLAMRKLWDSHVTWTRSYIVSALNKLGDLDAVTNRLLKNQDDIGNAIKPYYGEEAGNKLASLLRDHIMAAVAITKAAQSGNKAELARAQDKGKSNADAIADLLSGANPRWDKQNLKEKLYTHLQYVGKQVDSRLKKDWEAEIKAYDEGQKHMLDVADILSDGIVKQFPDKFK